MPPPSNASILRGRSSSYRPRKFFQHAGLFKISTPLQRKIHDHLLRLCDIQKGKKSAISMIVALAGRRVDKSDAQEPRFPLRNVDLVRTRTRELLRNKDATALVSSAACGADL